jgi:cytochrome c553
MIVLLALPTLAADTPTLHAPMQAHLEAATAARDAVIAGDLDTAKERFAWIAANEPQGLPADAVRRFDTLQSRARTGAEAITVMGAARSVAEIAGACGECHASSGVGPIFGPQAIPEGPSPADHMKRHQWAAERMWEGIAAPAQSNWNAGALMLLEEPLHRPGDPGVDPGVAAVALRVHQLGADTLGKLSTAERVQLYGDFLATCAACHAATGGGPKTP